MTSSVNFSHICLNEKQQMVHGTELEYNLQRYIYPAVALFGIMGNGLNLTVLLNRNMRSRANTFLAVLAFADIIFLSLLFPNILINYSFFTYNYYFRWFYFNFKVHMISLANWCSAVAIWCVIAVCGDRLVGIRNPLYARDPWPSWKMPLVVITIVFLTGVLTFYQHFEYSCLVRAYCNSTQLYSRCLPITSETWFGNRENPYSIARRNLISTCVMLYPILMIICPIILLAILNMMLICALRRRHVNLVKGGHIGDHRRPQEVTNFQKTEHRVTLTVTFIVTMFTITNGPSAWEHLVRKAYQIKQQEFYDLTMICSTLVIFGKASNFILFCLGSKHFRLRLFKLTQKKVNKKIGRVAYLHSNVRNIFTVLIRWRNPREPPTPSQETFSTTFFDRPAFGSVRRNSNLLLNQEQIHLNNNYSNGDILQINKKRAGSKPSFGTESKGMDRIRGRSTGSADLHKPLIPTNSQTTDN